jgi:hypothetical protein
VTVNLALIPLVSAKDQNTSPIAERMEMPVHAHTEIGSGGPKRPSSFCFFSLFIAGKCRMQIVAIMAMRARFSCLAAHDAELPTTRAPFAAEDPGAAVAASASCDCP